MNANWKAEYEKDGYVIIPDLVSHEDFEELKNACERVVSRTRQGAWPFRRTVGKQFPPYGQDNPDSWGVQHLMHPDLKEPIFAKWYTSPRFLRATTGLLGCQEEDLQMGMCRWRYSFIFFLLFFLLFLKRKKKRIYG